MGFPVDPFRKVARIHRMNPMNHKQVFELLQILDRIQVEVDYVETFPLAVERVRAILLDVRKFEQANGLYSPACFSTQGTK